MAEKSEVRSMQLFLSGSIMGNGRLSRHFQERHLTVRTRCLPCYWKARGARGDMREGPPMWPYPRGHCCPHCRTHLLHPWNISRRCQMFTCQCGEQSEAGLSLSPTFQITGECPLVVKLTHVQKPCVHKSGERSSECCGLSIPPWRKIRRKAPERVSFPFILDTLLYLMLGLPYQNAISWAV